MNTTPIQANAHAERFREPDEKVDPREAPFDREGFNDSKIEPEAAEIRKLLGLRPAHYVETGDSGAHPDQRPCPPWCWVGQSGGEYEHEVHARHPMSADHTMNASLSVVASLYQGQPPMADSETRYVSAATLEPRLDQVGQDQPQVRVVFRRYEGRESKFSHNFLRLSLEDAREFALALNYLVDLAEEG